MQKIKRILKWMFILILITVCAVIVSVVIGRGINSFTVKISSRNGVQETEYIDIGGIKQFIQIRGEDTRNPIILMLHGGPGSPMGFYSYYWQTPLEDAYTVVHWDQRGSGRTYYANDKDDSTYPTTEILLSDLNDLVDYLRNRFEQDKIIIMGHSWGTVLGTMYVQAYPEKVTSYIGIGQVVDSVEGDKLSSEVAAAAAIQAGNLELADSMREAYESLIGVDFSMKELVKLRNLTTPYLPSGDQMSGFMQMWMGVTSPYLGIDDIKWYLYPMIDEEGYFSSNIKLLRSLFQNGGVSLYRQSMQYQVPMYFISGNCDWITPYTMVEEYYEKITAPRKELIIIKNAGHNPFLDKPEEFVENLKKILQ